MATKTRAKAKRKKTTVTKTARRRKTVRKTRMIRKKAAKKAPPRRATRTKAKPTAKVAVKPTPVSQRAQPEAIKPTPVSQRAQPEAIKPTPVNQRAQPEAVKAPRRPAQPTAAEQCIGVVTHYYSHLSVVAMQLEPGTTLRVGDVIHIRGHTTDFTQKVEALEVNHAPVTEVAPNDDFGLKVVEHAREHDIVYKVRS